MIVGKKGEVATTCDPDEARNTQTPQARWKNRKKYLKLLRRESNQIAVLESKKGNDSSTANAHRVGDSYIADT